MLINCYLHRLIIATMQFNENHERAQDITKSGNEQIRIVYPKQNKESTIPKLFQYHKHSVRILMCFYPFQQKVQKI